MIIKKILLILIVAITLTFGLFWYINRSNLDIPSEEPSKEDIQKDTQYNKDKKQALIEGDAGKNKQNTSTAIEISTRQESDKTVTILSKITGQAGKDKCKLSISNNGKRVDQEADVIYQTEFSSCAGFTIPIDQLGAGRWSITISVGDKSNTTTAEVK